MSLGEGRAMGGSFKRDLGLARWLSGYEFKELGWAHVKIREVCVATVCL